MKNDFTLRIARNKNFFKSTRGVCASLLVLVLAMQGIVAKATTYTVTTTSNDVSVSGSLPWAVAQVDAGSGGDSIIFAIPGTGPFTITLPAVLYIYEKVTIDGTTQPGYAGTPQIEIANGEGASGYYGLYAGAPYCNIRGLAVTGFSEGGNCGITLQSDDTVSLCYLGLHPDGTAGGNAYGVNCNSGGNMIGGIGAGNVISANNYAGVLISGGSGNFVEGNLIGLNAAGTAAIGNNDYGILMNGGQSTTIGGNVAGAGNIISGNGGAGIYIYGPDDVIKGNYIGTNKAGTAAIGNGFGIYAISGNSQIGGTGSGDGNVISGNTATGIWLANVTSNCVIQGNLVGTDAAGIVAIGNVEGGIEIAAGCNTNTIGGTVAGAGNVISGNGGNGITIVSDSNTIQGNIIGLNATSGSVMGNGSSGIFIAGSYNTIGGTGTNANTVSGNTANGVTVTGTVSGNKISRNSIYSNGGLGIDLGNDGVTLNDNTGTRTGPNSFLNFPVITSITQTGGNTTVYGAYYGSASSNYTIDFFNNSVPNSSGYGEGKTYIGNATASTDGSGNGTFSISIGGIYSLISATATDDSNNTSEFSQTGPVFINASPQALLVCGNSGATSFATLLNVSDVELGQTLSWSQSSAPSHGSLTITGATANSGSTNITSGGTIAYTPASGYTGTDAFTIMVSDGTATASMVVNVTVNALPAISAGSNLGICTGSSTNLTASGGISYLWSTDPTLSATTGASVTADPATTDTYTVTGTDANGCSNTATVTVVVSPTPNPIITASGPTTFCSGQSVLLSSSAAGNALDLDGYSQFVAINNTPSIANLGVSGFTLEAWVYYSGSSDVNSIIRKSGDYNFYIYNNTLGAEVWPAGAGVNPTFSKTLGSVTIPANTWTHVAATWDGTSCTLYVNGVADGGASTSAYSNGTNEDLSIGYSYTFGQLFQGTLDEVRIWNTARSGTQIAANMNVGVNSLSTGLVAYYKFDEGSGSATADATGNGNNGTLEDGPVWVVPSTAPINYSGYVWSPGGATTSSITVTTTGSYSVTVTNANGCSNTSAGEAVNVTSVNALPAITSVSPMVGYPSSVVTITGSGFSTTTSNDIVFFGATQAVVSSATATSLSVTVPVGATYMPVSVDNLACTLTAYADYPFLPNYNNSAFVAGTANFSTPVDFTTVTGSSPETVAIGDIDGDGKPDLVVTDASNNTISIFRNTSSSGSITAGSFAAPVYFSTGSYPFKVAIGDVDGDGKPDVVIINYTPDNTMGVFRNTSTPGSIDAGSLAPQVTFAVGNSPYDVAIADIDRDGKADVVVTNANSNTISVFRNTSTAGSIDAGSFATQVTFATGTTPEGLAIGDIDGDGKPDVVVTNINNYTIGVLRNTSTAGSIDGTSFAPQVAFAAGNNPTNVAIADMDGDGKLDVVVSNYIDNTISVFLNTSSAGSITTSSLATQVTFATGYQPYNLAIGDIDGDGKPDVVTANYGTNTASVLLNTSTVGSITASSLAPQVAFVTGNGAVFAAIGDLDGDGRPELAVVNDYAQTISILWNNPLQPITGAAAICGGTTLTLSDATTGGTWSSGSTGIATVDATTGMVTAVSGGTVAITYAGSAGAGFAGNIATTIVTVIPYSAGSITGYAEVCVAATTSLMDGAGGGAWSSSNTSVASVDTTGIVTGITSGTATISYTVTNSCGTVSTTDIVTVSNALPVVDTIAGSLMVCAGATINLSDDTSSGVWSTASTAVANVDGTGIVTGFAGGTATISYTVTNGCGSTAATAIVTVTPFSTGFITGTTAVCAASTTNLTDGAGDGTWSSSNTSVANVDTTGVVTGVAGGTATISYTVTNWCGSISATDVVTVSSGLPVVNNITGTTTLCTSTTANLYDATGGGLWSSGSTGIATVNTAGIVTALNGGTATISYTVTNACGSASATTIVYVNFCTTTYGYTGATQTFTVPAGVTSIAVDVRGGKGGGISGDYGYQSIGGCGGRVQATINVTPGHLINIRVGNAGGTNGVGGWPGGGTDHGFETYWPGAGGGGYSEIRDSTTSSILVVAGGGGGGGGFTTGEDAGGGGGGTCSGCVAGNGASGICGTTSGGHGGSTTGGTGGCSGSGVTGGSLTGAAVPLGSYGGGGGGGYYGGGSGYNGGGGGGGSSYTNTAYVPFATFSKGYNCANGEVIITVPTGAIAGVTTVCQGYTTPLSDATLGGTWSSGNTGIATVGSSGIVTGITAGTATISYTVMGSTVTTVVTVNAAPNSGTINGTTTICAGSTTQLSDASTGGVWSSNNTAVVTVNSTGLVTGTGSGSTTIYYTTTNGCGSSHAYAILFVNPLPTAGAITGPSSVVAGSNITLTDAASGGAWSASNANATVSGGVVTGVTAGTDNISYSVTNSCGNAVATKAITVSNISIPPINGNTSICEGNTTMLTDALTGGVWSMGSLVATINGSTGIVTASSAYTGTATVTYTAGSAYVTTIVTVNANPSPIQGASAECAGTTVTISDAASGGVWSGTGDATILGTGTSGTLVAGAGGGTATVTYTVGAGCYATATSTIYAGPLPISGTFNVCVGGITILSDASAGTNWTSSNTAVAVASGADITGMSAGTAVITFKSNGAGYCTVTQTVTVSAQPAAIAGNTGVLCPGTMASLTDGSGTWSSSAITIATVGSTSGIVTAATAGTATITYSASGAAGCVAMTIVTVSTVPAITGTGTICTGGTTVLHDAVSGGAWSSGTPGIATINAAGLVTGVANGSTTITYTTASGCTGTFILTVSSSFASISGNLFICDGSTTTLSDASTGGTWSMSSAAASVVGSTGVVTASATVAGTATISYISGSCLATAVLTVNAKPALIQGVTSECSGITITLTDATAGGTWSGAGDATITGVGTTGTLVAGGVSGTATVTYTIGTGCMATMTNTIYSVQPIQGNFSLCVGLVTLLSDASPASSWTSSNTAVAIASGADISGVSAGTATITFKTSAAGTCITTQVVTVSAMPVVTAINGPASISHTGSPVTISDATAGGIWTSSNTSVITLSGSTGSPIGATAHTTTGSSVITYAVTISGCTTKVTKTFSATTATHTTATIYAGSEMNLADDVASGVWSSSDNGVATVDGNGLVTGIMPGNVTITHETTGDDGTAGKNVTNVAVTALPAVLNILPNPNKGTFTVKGTVGSLADESVTLEITDLLGQIIYRNKVTAYGGKLDEMIMLSNTLSNGMYILNVQSGTENKTFHFVIEQ